MTITLPDHNGEISRLKKHYAIWGISIDETMLESDKQYPSLLYVYNPYKIKIPFYVCVTIVLDVEETGNTRSFSLILGNW
jgi:hypothetical protein